MNRKLVIGAAVMGVLATVLGTLGGPRSPRLSDATSGDEALAARVRAAIDDSTGYRGLSVAIIENGQVRFAGLGAADRDGERVPGADTPFEMGSVAKVLTGMLLADLAKDGAVRPDDQLRSILPSVRFADDRLAGTTLEELTSHRSGLPSVYVNSIGVAARAWYGSISGGDPYAGQDVAWLRDAVAGARTGKARGEVTYSNFGVAVLGYALGERTGTPYPELLRREVLRPLGMDGTVFTFDGAPPPDGAAEGSSASGRTRAPWTASGIAPAGGGAWSTSRDLSDLVVAMLAGTAPGADAATPRFPAGEAGRIGYGWFTTEFNGTTLTWHNGGTGGFRSFVGFDPAAQRGVVVLGNTDRDVDPIGIRLLGGNEPDEPPSSPLGGVIAALILTYAGGLGLLAAALATARRTWYAAAADRLRLLTAAVWAVAGPAVAYLLDGWLPIGPIVWGLGVGLAAAAAVLAAARWRSLGWPTRWVWIRWLGAALSVAFAVLAPVALLATQS
jgi:CubicO group peptidase (beta-lactamase class C family)